MSFSHVKWIALYSLILASLSCLESSHTILSIKSVGGGKAVLLNSERIIHLILGADFKSGPKLFSDQIYLHGPNLFLVI